MDGGDTRKMDNRPQDGGEGSVDGILSGVKVAAFTHFAAGPLAAQYLGALGADVIKVEGPNRDVNRYAIRDPHGKLDGISPYFVCTNRNQRCLGLDLKSEGGRAAARRLVETADVLIENYRPGVMDRLGLGYEEIRALNPRIVYCSFSAYDRFGPARDKPGQDLLIQALSGLASLSGREGGPPVPVGAYLVDGFTSLQGVIGILGALLHRSASGEGQWVRADMMSVAMYMMAQEASFVLNVERDAKRSAAGVAHFNQSAPYGVYQAKDGAIALSIFGNVEGVRKIAEVLDVMAEVEPYLSEGGLRDHRDEVAGAFAGKIALMSRAEATACLAPTGVWIEPVRTLGEALEDEAVVASDVVRTVETPYGGRYRTVIEPLKMSETPIAFSRPAPAHGEHTAEVLEGLGYSAAEIALLLDEGAAFGSPRACSDETVETTG